jgi:hypothetical protein
MGHVGEGRLQARRVKQIERRIEAAGIVIGVVNGGANADNGGDGRGRSSCKIGI